ncbi:hypothetical protein CCUS01_03420 [Colletotrichum cuscutae]|uniref:Uncharacterized protein n=1 Tax=Colletotrichum cuscutae TaxID=1209917 RepID=A0AAI9Y8G6_9PEZI|nr:hypothetical protein CCUS01_03420 [Colletotrichum cuscutae]
MQNWATLIMAALVAGSAAKDCALFYDSTVSDPFMASIPASNAQWYCKNDIGGTMEDKESNISNSATNPNFRCGICRGARSSTKDYDIPDKIGNYAIRCGYYAPGRFGHSLAWKASGGPRDPIQNSLDANLNETFVEDHASKTSSDATRSKGCVNVGKYMTSGSVTTFGSASTDSTYSANIDINVEFRKSEGAYSMCLHE